MKWVRNGFMVFMLLQCLLSWSFSSHAKTLTSDERLADFHQLIFAMQAGYGPLHYKIQVQKIDFNGLYEKYRKEIINAQSNGEFYYLMVQFVAEFKDGHFVAFVPTTHAASLPFTTDLVDGKVLIDTIDRTILSEEAFPFERGDEVTWFDGKRVGAVLDDISKFLFSGTELSLRRKAAMFLTYRPGKVFPVPHGQVKMTIRQVESGILEDVELNWTEGGFPLDESESRSNNPFSDFDNDVRPDFDGDNFFGHGHTRTPVQVPFRQEGPFIPTKWNRPLDNLSSDWFMNAVGKEKTERSFRCSGSTRTSVPEDATIIMEEPFVAYYHPMLTSDGEEVNVGYLRIPHYSPMNLYTGAPEYELRLEQYKYALAILQQKTAGLVIDQDHNCGGSAEYLHKLVELFMDRPFRPVQFQLLASKTQYMQYLSFMQYMELAGMDKTLMYGDFSYVTNLIKQTWEEGQQFLTPLTGIHGAAYRYPQTFYTRPVLILIDELSGSGGDAFPSIMQGLGRAKLFGTQTMGLGGHVVSVPPLNYSGIMVHMTKSLFYRPDGVPVENNGAIPDVSYTITRNDFLHQYVDYQEAYLDEMMDMIEDQ